MKKLILATAFASITGATADDWLALKDGYIWPEEQAAAPKFKGVWNDFEALSARLQSAVKACWPDNKPPLKVETVEVDLNGDGAIEVFVGIPAYSGTGYSILTQKDEGFQEIGSLLGFGIKFLPTQNKWLQIEGRSNAGGGHHTRYLLTFKNDQYRMTRIENHELANQIVTVRKPNQARDSAGKSTPAVNSKSEGKEKTKPKSEGNSQ